MCCGQFTKYAQARKPGWWVLLADGKTNRIIVPPMKISDVPFSDVSNARNFRAYKLQFQAPQAVGMYTWKLYAVSDTFMGEDFVQDMVVSTILWILD
jgi:translocation protein SEC63